jgi:stress-induced-phosphoprotein 1
MSEKQLAQQAKDLGNKAFAEKRYQEAIDHFTRAIELDSSDHVFFSNRSASYASLSQYDKALEDANRCVDLKPDWVRGYTRKGLAEFYLNKYEEAIETYEKGLKIEPNNAQLLEGLQRAQEKLTSSSNPIGQLFTGENLAKLMTNPKTSKYFQQPDFVNMLNMMQQNPQFAQAFMNDPRFMDCLGVALGMDISSPGNPEARTAPPSEPKPAYQEPPKPKPQEKQPETLSPEEQKKRQAEEEKNAGNAAYKKRKFDEAISHYEKAIELVPEEIVYVTNKATALFEKKEYEKCIEACEEAVKKGREVHAEYSKIAKALARKGNALEKLGDLEGAIKAFKDSLHESHDDKVKFQLRDLEKLKKKRDEQAYLNPDLAEQHNSAGNEHFKQGKFPDALTEYSEAILRNPTVAKYYSNRSAAYLKLLEPASALTDINKCLELDPNFVKAYGRKGNIHFLMKEYHKAMETFEKGLKLDPDNAECKEGFQKTAYTINSSSADQPDEERLKHALSDPEIQNILRDPQINQVLREMQERPAEAQRYLSDEKIRTAISKLVAAGVVRMG